MSDQQLQALDINEYDNLKTPKERADYLLKFDVTAKIDLDEFDIVYRAFVGFIRLPVTASSEDIAIKKGTKFLEDKVASNEY